MKKIFLLFCCLVQASLGIAQTDKLMVASQQPFGLQENKGQFEGFDKKAASYVLFKVQAPNINIWVTTAGLTYQFLKFDNEAGENGIANIEKSHTKIEPPKTKVEWRRVDMILKGSSIKSENVFAEGILSKASINYYHANSPSGVLNVKTFEKVTIYNVYPGIDWVLFISNGTLEHDFVVHPNADPNLIKLIYEGSGSLDVQDRMVSFKNEIGNVKEGLLTCYQGDKSNTVISNYTLSSNSSLSYLGAGNGNHSFGKEINAGKTLFSSEVSIQMGRYNRSETLIIDPQLVWGTYFGGSAPEIPKSIACDKSGNAYITGIIFDVGFPTQSWGGAYYQSVFGGALFDAFVLGFNNDGVLNWATYYGGAEGEWANSVTCDGNNNVYITGNTVMEAGISVSTFPLQNWTGAFNQPTAILNAANAFLLRFNGSTGVRSWGTFCAEGEARSVTCDATGRVYVTGSGTVNPAQTWPGAYNDGTFAGGFDIFVLRFSNTGALTWATNYGGPNYEEGIDISTDESGNIYVVGASEDSLPIQNRPGAFNQAAFTGGFGDGFILRFNASGALTWASYFPGTTQFTNVACDADGNVYVTGYSSAVDDGPFLTQDWPGAYNQPVYGGGDYDACILRFDPSGVLIWSTFYGGADQELIGNFSSGSEMVLDLCGNVYISLTTSSINPNTIYTYSSCGQYSYSGTPLGSKSMLLKFTNSGAVSWATLFGGNGGAAGWGFMLALDNQDDLFITKAVYEPNFAWPLVDPGAGAYFDTIPDLQEDLYVAKFTPVLPAFTQSQVNDSACSCGSATITLTCGEPNYNYVWSNGSQTLSTDSTSNTITGLSPGNYIVTATSACHQDVIASFTILGVVAGIENRNLDNQFSIYPNPSNKYFFVKTKEPNENIELKLFNLVGQLVYSENLNGKSEYQIQHSAITGMYMLQLVSNSKKFSEKIVIE